MPLGLLARTAAASTCRHGKANGLQRYRCRACRRTFNALSGTPLSGLHKREKWSGQAAALQDDRALQTVAKDLGVHVGTVHRWRHRFLALPQAAQPEALVGIAEADETMFLLSFNGQHTLPRKARKRDGKDAKRGLSREQIPVLVACDRSSITPSTCPLASASMMPDMRKTSMHITAA